MPLDLLLALACLLSADVKLDKAPAPLSAFQAVGLHMELIDPRETRYVFCEQGSFGSDLELVQRRAAELIDTPPACDAARFPGLSLGREMCAANSACTAWLCDRRDLFPAEEWIEEALIECEQLRRAWSLLVDARSEYYYVFVRRRALQQLRDEIGPRLYYAGCLPPPVPIWRYRRIE